MSSSFQQVQNQPTQYFINYDDDDNDDNDQQRKQQQQQQQLSCLINTSFYLYAIF